MTQTECQLKEAYRRSGLWRLGMTFAKAMNEKAIRIGLECVVKSSIKKTGKPAPIQPALL